MKSNEKLKSHNELKLMTDYEKLNTAFALFLVIGFIMLFINWKIALLLFTLSISTIIYASKKYPEEHKKFMEQKSTKQNNAMNLKISNAIKTNFKFYTITHIQGIEELKQFEKCEISISDNDVSFDKKDNFLASFNYDELKQCVLYEEVSQEYKDKNPLCRAIVGGIILGPVGAAIGGISGIAPTIKEKKNYYLEFEFIDNDIMENIIIGGDFAVLEEIRKQIANK